MNCCVCRSACWKERERERERDRESGGGGGGGREDGRVAMHDIVQDIPTSKPLSFIISRSAECIERELGRKSTHPHTNAMVMVMIRKCTIFIDSQRQAF